MDKTKDLILRYAIIIILGLGNLYIFYEVLTPLTTELSSFFIGLFSQSPVQVYSNLILMTDKIIEIVPACVAGSAYYLLLTLNLSTPNIRFKKRMKIILLTLITLFILNILRIVVLSFLANTSYFEIVHYIFWYSISIIFVVLIWFSAVKIFKIKSIPVFHDIKFLLEKSKLLKENSKKKKTPKKKTKK